jgi:AraC family transcriptional regulator, ethanolamine operon transcriptional activator
LGLPTSTKPPAKGAGSLICHRQFSDIDQLAEQVQPIAKLAMTQLSCDRLHFDLVLAVFAEIQFVFAKSSCPVFSLGEKPKNFITFGCLLETQGPYLVSHDRRISYDTLSGMDASLAAKFVMPANQRCVFVQVRRDVLQDCLQALDRGDLDEKFWDNNYVRAPATMPMVKAYLGQLLTLIQHQPNLLQQPHFKELLLEDFVPLLINALPPLTKDLLMPPPILSRMQLVQRAEDYMLAHLDQPITLKELCQALHVSSRPLFYGFQEVFGVSPMEYLKVQRLRGVRRSLRTADPETSSVTAIAQCFGFWSAGHFARDYKTMFGELPSETLKQ